MLLFFFFFFTSGLIWLDLVRHATWVQHGVVNSDTGSGNGLWYGEYISGRGAKEYWVFMQYEEFVKLTPFYNPVSLRKLLRSFEKLYASLIWLPRSLRLSRGTRSRCWGIMKLQRSLRGSTKQNTRGLRPGADEQQARTHTSFMS